MLFYWLAFGELSTERQLGMGIGPIPRSSIMAYAAEHQLFGDAAEQFLDIIRAVDDAYLRVANAPAKEVERENVARIDDPDATKDVLRRMQLRAANAAKKQVKGHGRS